MREALVDNAANARQVREAKQKEKDARFYELEDFRFLLRDRRGRRIVWRYLSKCGIFKTSFSQDPHRTAFNEGERNIGLALLADVTEADPVAYLTMMTEAKEDERNGKRSSTSGGKRRKDAGY